MRERATGDEHPMTDQQNVTQFRAQSGFALDEFVEHQERQRTMPYLFPLYASSIGRKKVWKVLARRLTIMDRASIGHLPDHLQNFVWSQMKEVQKEVERRQELGEEAKNIQEALANNDQNIRMANLYCHAAFVDPTIVLNQREENLSERKLFVDRVAAEDRIAFMLGCNDAAGEQGRLFETFRPESGVDAPDRDVVPVAPQPIRDPEVVDIGH